MPVFFGLAGLKTDLTILVQPNLFLLTLVLIGVASIGKFAGAFVGAEIGGLTKREALAVGCAMNARGSTEVIVATIGLSMGALSHDLYTMIVAMAVVTTMAMPPMLRWALSRVPLRKAEKQRLEREAMEAKEFIPNLERLLLVVDDSHNGQFTSHIAGLVAGSRGMPITVLPLDGANQKPSENKEAESDHVIDEIIKAAAKGATRSISDEPSVEVTIRPVLNPTHEEAIKIEAKKGYDLLFIGLEKMKSPSGSFDSRIDEIVAAFEGPMATVMAGGKQLEKPTSKTLDVLVPITGTDVSRRAAEIAFSLGKGATVTALYVEQRSWVKAGSGRLSRQARTILNDIAEMASRYKVKIETRKVSGVRPANAILNEAKAGEHDLIVMGVSRRPGEKLYFGDTPTAVLTKSPCSLLFLST
jgi:nucleotide-binding universal stress UspA family protein